jgi:N-acetylglutamate synthase
MRNFCRGPVFNLRGRALGIHGVPQFQRKSGMNIRRMAPEDYDNIIEVWRMAGLNVEPGGRESRESFLHQLEEFGGLMLVAEEGGKTAGVVIGSHDRRKGWINRLAVLPEFRGRGAAKELISRVEEEFARIGLKIFAGLILEDNGASMKVAESMGYTRYDYVKYFSKKI